VAVSSLSVIDATAAFEPQAGRRRGSNRRIPVDSKRQALDPSSCRRALAARPDSGHQTARRRVRQDTLSQRFAKGASSGELSQDLIFPYPRMDPDQAEIVEMPRDSIRRFAAERIDDVRIDAEARISREVLDELTAMGMGIMGMIIPEANGGSGMSVTAYCKPAGSRRGRT
jgi:hypothetical protein